MTKEQRERLEFIDKLYQFNLTCDYCAKYVKKEYGITTCEGCPIYSQNFSND